MEGDNNLKKDKKLISGILIGFFGVGFFILLIWGLLYLNSLPLISDNGQSADFLAPNIGPQTESILNPAINTFELKKDAVICKIEDKPVIYLFSTTVCPHCQWVKPIFDRVASEYVEAGKIKAHHWELDTGDDALTAEIENQIPLEAEKIYQEFNPNDSVPTFVFGCKYFRVGNGYEQENDPNKEEQELRAVIDDLLESR